MTLIDLSTDLAYDLFPLEATQPTTPVHWLAFDGEGICNWLDVRLLIEHIGHVDAFAFLVLRGADFDRDNHRFAQSTGTAAAAKGLLVEIAQGDTVAVVAPRNRPPGRLITITEESPWCETTADESTLTDVSSMLAISYDWITAGLLDTEKYELRSVPGFDMPTLIR